MANTKTGDNSFTEADTLQTVYDRGTTFNGTADLSVFENVTGAGSDVRHYYNVPTGRYIEHVFRHNGATEWTYGLFGGNHFSLNSSTFGGNVFRALSNGNFGIHTNNPTATFHNNGSYAVKIRQVTAAGTLLADDYMLISTGTFTFTLTAASGQDGRIVEFKNEDDPATSTSVLTVDADGTETIEGQLSIGIGPGESARLVCDGSKWMEVGA